MISCSVIDPYLTWIVNKSSLWSPPITVFHLSPDHWFRDKLAPHMIREYLSINRPQPATQLAVHAVRIPLTDLLELPKCSIDHKSSVIILLYRRAMSGPDKPSATTLAVAMLFIQCEVSVKRSLHLWQNDHSQHEINLSASLCIWSVCREARCGIPLRVCVDFNATYSEQVKHFRWVSEFGIFIKGTGCAHSIILSVIVVVWNKFPILAYFQMEICLQSKTKCTA